MSYVAASEALKDLTVLDLTRARAGPTAARQLADWGANVIKIEAPEALDAGDPVGDTRHGPDFQNLHRNTRSLTINLKSPGGVDMLKRLAAKADVLIENYRPRVKDRLGIDYDTLRAVNPALIYASISGFGQDGPYRDRPGVDQIAQGMGGLMSITGLPGQGPVRVGIPISDLCAGILLSQAIMVALFERQKSGQGQWLHTSLLETQIFMLDFQAARWLIGHEVPQQAGNDHPTGTPTSVYKTRDGQITIGAAGQNLWERLCRAIGADALIGEPGYATGADRFRNRPELNQKLGTIIETFDTKDIIDLLNEAGVPCGPIYTIDEVFADPQVQHLAIPQPVTSPKLGRLEVVRQPVTASRTPSRIELPSPERGEHNAEILQELGYDAEQIEAFRTEGVI
ncbi:MAG: CoA transferase [Proteobacteria bacterium]|nr:CoA transferase [Pseudomonadota bacterium]